MVDDNNRKPCGSSLGKSDGCWTLSGLDRVPNEAELIGRPETSDHGKHLRGYRVGKTVSGTATSRSSEGNIRLEISCLIGLRLRIEPVKRRYRNVSSIARMHGHREWSIRRSRCHFSGTRGPWK